MSFSIAIIGDYGVGKSTLSEVFSSCGVKMVELGKKKMICQADRLKTFTPSEVISQDDVQVIQDHIQAMKEKYNKILFEIPPYFFKSKYISQVMQFDFVIYVMSTLESREKYLKEKYCLSGKDGHQMMFQNAQELYLSYATDIFLNTVSIDRIQWVGSKLLKSFEVLKS